MELPNWLRAPFSPTNNKSSSLPESERQRPNNVTDARVAIDADAAEAGNGEAHVVLLASENAKPVESSDTYLGVDIVAVYVNKEPEWLRSKSAVGSVEFTVKGSDTVNRLIGPYDLQKDTKVAPLFNVPLLEDQPFSDDLVTIKLKLKSIKKDTEMLPILRAVVDWGSQVGGTYLPLLVPGIAVVQAAAAPGEAANRKLMDTLKQFVFNGEDQEAIFDLQSGIEYSLRPENIPYSETYLLFHRGSKLDRVTISEMTGTPVPCCVDSNGNKRLLEDGAWVLLRITRKLTLKGIRPWDPAVRKLEDKLTRLEQEVREGATTPSLALSKVRPDRDGTLNLYSAYTFLFQMILEDPTLTKSDAKVRATSLADHFNAVRQRLELKAQESPDGNLGNSSIPVLSPEQTQVVIRALLQSGGILPSNLRLPAGSE